MRGVKRLSEEVNYDISLSKQFKSKGVKLEDGISYKTFKVNVFIDAVLIKRGSKELDLVVVFSEGVVDEMLSSELVVGEDLYGILSACNQLRNSLVSNNPLMVSLQSEVVEYKIMNSLVKPEAKEIVDLLVESLRGRVGK